MVGALFENEIPSKHIVSQTENYLMTVCFSLIFLAKISVFAMFLGIGNVINRNDTQK